MSDPQTLPLGSRLRSGTSWAFAKLQSIPPLVTLPALGLAAWFATPYAINLAAGRGADVTTTADAGETDGTTATQRSDPVARKPATEPSTPSPVGTAGGAGLLTRPITASAIPSWLPVPAPAPAATPAPRPAQPRVTTYAASPAPRPAKATARLIAPLPQQRVADRQPSWGGVDQRRSTARLPDSQHNGMQTGRSAATGSGLAPRGMSSNGYQPHTNAAGGYRAPVMQPRWPTVGGYRGPMVQSGFGGPRVFSPGNFSGMRGGGSGGFRGGGHR